MIYELWEQWRGESSTSWHDFITAKLLDFDIVPEFHSNTFHIMSLAFKTRETYVEFVLKGYADDIDIVQGSSDADG